MGTAQRSRNEKQEKITAEYAEYAESGPGEIKYWVARGGKTWKKVERQVAWEGCVPGRAGVEPRMARIYTDEDRMAARRHEKAQTDDNQKAGGGLAENTSSWQNAGSGITR
jgi:hypothetical protein